MILKSFVLLAAVLPGPQQGQQHKKPHKVTPHKLFVTERHHLPRALSGRCSSGCAAASGIAYPANYRYEGIHDGAYQYTPSTWLRTIPYLPRRLRRVATHRTASTASPAEQDVRTAYFYPSHAGEWACSA